MPRAWIHLAFAVALISSPTAASHAQDTPATRAQLRIIDSTKIQLITLRDGSSLVGRIVAVRGDTVDFEMSVGRAAVSVGDIREIRETAIGTMHDGQYWSPNPNSTRLFFAPSGQMLKKG